MSEDIMSSLIDLKNKLYNIEENFVKKEFTIEKREKVHERLEQKLENLFNIQSEKIKIEAGGKIYETTNDSIVNCMFENILKNKILQQEITFQSVYYENNQPVVKEKIFYVDLDKENFKLILQIVRHFNSKTFNGNKFQIFLTKLDFDLICDEINYFFKDNKDIYNYLEFRKN